LIIVKIPKTITIASHEVELLLDGAQDDKGWRGTYSTRTQTILLNPQLLPGQLRVTLLHEIVHLICDIDDMSPSEQDINRLAESLGDILFRCFGIDFDLSEIPILERKTRDEL